MRSGHVWGAGVGLVLLLAACSGDKAPGSNEYADAFADVLKVSQDYPLDVEQAECLGRELVAAVGGPEVFEAAEISPEDLGAGGNAVIPDLQIDADRAGAIADALPACKVSLKDALLESFDDTLSPSVKECVAAAVDDDELAAVFAQGLIDADDPNALPPPLVQQLTTCTLQG